MAKNKQPAERANELTPPVRQVRTIEYRPVPKFGGCPGCLKTGTK